MRIILVVCIIVNGCMCQLKEPLREAALKAGIFIGAAANFGDLHSDSEYATILGQQYDLATAENSCKWKYTEPNYNQYTFEHCDYVYNYAKSKNQTFRGHNLCWNQVSSNPAWLVNGNYTPPQLQTILENHITTVMQHYPGDNVYCWDVVNEAVNDNQKNGLYKDGVWYPAIPNYVDIAFQTARKANPNTKLFYNDYNIYSMTGATATKSNAVYNMTKSMIARNIPIDGIGIQGHMHIDGEYPLDYNGIYSNLKRFGDLGLEIHITEASVTCGSKANGQYQPCSNFTQQLETKQAEMYQTFLKACLAVDKCRSFETWGYTDKYNAWGTDEYPLPFDINFKPKTAAIYIENELLAN